ncbi:MAG: D-2-hydroxyacid dehydrogenase [Clostridia bacterium]|nr:D-2-hydroxyacid dehydrogenase [Clostridia bacterium]
MQRTLAVFFPVLSQGQITLIEKTAQAVGFRCVFLPDESVRPEELRDAEVFFGVSAALPSAMPKLKWVASPNAGVEPYCNPGVLPDSVTLTNSAGAYGVTISEHIVMVTLELLRQRLRYLSIVAARDWTRDLPVSSILGSRILMLGTGDIGKETARRLRAFAPARIIGLNRSGRCEEALFDFVGTIDRIGDFLPETDILIASLPGTPLTAGLLNEARLRMLPRHACIVNVGRGSLIDETALRALLEAGELAGAALDVFCEEPLPADSPLWQTANLIITPHISGNTTLPYTKDRIVALFLDDLRRYAADEPFRRVVDRSLGY